MSLLARALAWGILLTGPCFLLSAPYQALLARAASGALACVGIRTQLEVDLHEPFSVGFFLSLCLASRRSRRAQRLRAMVVGAAALAVLSGLLVAVIVVGGRMLPPEAQGLSGGARRFLETILELVPWLAAPGAWLLLLGRRELGAAWFHDSPDPVLSTVRSRRTPPASLPKPSRLRLPRTTTGRKSGGHAPNHRRSEGTTALGASARSAGAAGDRRTDGQ